METPEESLDRQQHEVAQLRASRERLVVAADSDRRRLERDLHDGPQQDLIALAVNLQHARDLVGTDPSAARELLETMGRDVDHALEEMAALAQRIYPPLLEAGGLGAALRAAAVSAGVRATISVGDVGGSTPEAAGAVYFCWLELIESAGGGGATIDVEVVDGSLVFQVRGGDHDHVSLERSRDRVEALGGRLTTESRPEGATVSGSLPLGR